MWPEDCEMNLGARSERFKVMLDGRPLLLAAFLGLKSSTTFLAALDGDQTLVVWESRVMLLDTWEC